MTTALLELRPFLYGHHNLVGFDCGNTQINQLAREGLCVGQDIALVHTAPPGNAVLAYIFGNLIYINERDTPYVKAGVDMHPRISTFAFHVGGLGVDKRLQSHGFGRALVQGALREAHGMLEGKCSRIGAVTTQAKEGAVPFYKSLGFADCRKIFCHLPQKGVFMLRLEAPIEETPARGPRTNEAGNTLILQHFSL